MAAKLSRKNIVDLMGFAANLRVAHWQADTVTNTHKTLGDLYEAIDGLTDDLAEMAMGKDGSVEFPEANLVLKPGVSLAELLQAGLNVLSNARAECVPGVDDDLLNTLADMSAAINRAKYLLKV